MRLRVNLVLLAEVSLSLEELNNIIVLHRRLLLLVQTAIYCVLENPFTELSS